MKADLSTFNYNFERSWIDDLPMKLEIIQDTYEDIGADEMVINIVSLAHKNLKPGRDTSEYFRVLLLEALRVGTSMLSYGNESS